MIRTEGLLSKPLFHFLVIGIFALLAYGNTFQAPFQWDESYFIVGNPAVQNPSYFFDPEPVQGISVYGFKNRYVGYLTFSLNYWLQGYDVFGYHVFNFSIHLINALLVYLLVLLTFSTPYFQGLGTGGRERGKRNQEGFNGGPDRKSRVPYFFALAVALLFVSHPVQTEAVTYVFQRFTSLVSMFYLLSLILYIKARQSAMGLVHGADGIPQNWKKNVRYAFGPTLYYLFSLVFAILAMKTKENAFTLPVVIALYEFLFFSGPLKVRILILLPLIATMVIIPVNIVEIEGSFKEVLEPMTEPTAFGTNNLTRWEYLYTQFRVIITYMRLLFFPLNQNVVYDYPTYQSPFELPVVLSFLFLSTIFISAILVINKTQRAESRGHNAQIDTRVGSFAPCAMRYGLYRLVAFGILWFFITLSVESSIVPLAMVIDEYRLYLPSTGFFLAIAGAVLLLFRRFSIPATAAGTALAVILVALSSMTYARNALWADKVSLWEDVASKNVNSPKVYNNLGIAYYEKSEYEKAVDMYNRAITLNPDNFFAFSNLGVIYAVTGRLDRAIEAFTKAAVIDPRNSVAFANLARAYRQSGEFVKAAQNYERAVELNPYDWMLFFELGSTYTRSGKFEEAISVYSRCIGLNPLNPEGYLNRGLAYSRVGDSSKAAADFNRACSMGNRQSCSYLR